ncbi:hypothetical protein IO99_06830 [Clostridium sulfidigenes]|uniref:L-2-amino-thiazoline-4-carboxylic acid hydrolase n=1 Tax=Clostridium sulfidigenes TaxID=318464 RepID=A0A084JE91_9CLOT|nr:L-2-amino-thiazoline-4-carboxylic acid hydrolase [Clostridium sulfidigenes]KEZ87275.1 hypothetical protein IO99_06830 [Clostridium sulfidigenes]
MSSEKEIKKRLYIKYTLKEIKKILKKKQWKKVRIEELEQDIIKCIMELEKDADYGENDYKKHALCNSIFPGIAAYQILQKYGFTKDEAYYILENVFESIAKLAGMIYNMLDLLPNGYKLIRKSLWNDMKGKNRKCWETDFLQDDDNGFAYTVNKCIFVDVPLENSCSEISKLYCKNDTYCFRGLHRHVKWKRTQTLGEGGNCCDFVFEKVK